MYLIYEKFNLLNLSFLENGAISKFLGEEGLTEIFVKEESSNSCYKKRRSGLKAVGMYQVSKSFFLRTLSIFSLYWKTIQPYGKTFLDKIFRRRKLVFLKLLCNFTQKC